MTDHDGTVSVAAPSSVFGGSVLSELPDDDEGAGGRPSRKAIRPKEVWMNDGRVEVWRKNGLPSAVQQVLDASGSSLSFKKTSDRPVANESHPRSTTASDLYTSPLSASFSEQTGFASLLTHSALYVWSYLVRQTLWPASARPRLTCAILSARNPTRPSTPSLFLNQSHLTRLSFRHNRTPCSFHPPQPLPANPACLSSRPLARSGSGTRSAPLSSTTACGSRPRAPSRSSWRRRRPSMDSAVRARD